METLLPQAEHLSCLRVCLADNHRSDRVIVLLSTETAEVRYDIVEQRIKVTFILNNLIAVDVRLLHFYASSQFVEDVLNLFLVDGLHRLTHKFASIAISD